MPKIGKTPTLQLRDAMSYFEKPREACGLFGIYGHPEAARLTYFGMYALQHRGQESAGIAVVRENNIVEHKGMGLVPDVFDVTHLEHLEGKSAIGHVRYSTTGSSILSNAQPFVVHHRKKAYAIAHNGNLVNAHHLKRELEETGSIFQTTMDSEIFLHYFVKSLDHGFEGALKETASRLKGAYSFVMLTSRGEVVGIKDPHGFRPLCLGRLNGHYILASETCALDLVQAEFIRELDPGEIVIIDENGIQSIKPSEPGNRAFCIFEFIYFARPDSTIYGQNVYLTRKAHGRRLAQEAPVEAEAAPEPAPGEDVAVAAESEEAPVTATHAPDAVAEEREPAPEPEPVTESQPAAADSASAAGLTSEGRAMNDPRVSPSPVQDVHIETARMTLFAEHAAPPVATPDRNVPRASNDPRGPRDQGAEAAEA